MGTPLPRTTPALHANSMAIVDEYHDRLETAFRHANNLLQFGLIPAGEVVAGLRAQYRSAYEWLLEYDPALRKQFVHIQTKRRKEHEERQ